MPVTLVTDVPLTGRRGLADALRRALDAAGERRSQLALLVTTDERMRMLNASYRGRDETTDVLSFGGDDGAPGTRRHLGDLAISLARAEAQAAEVGHGVADELVILAVHGLVHLLGHDHETPAQSVAMAEVEERLLGALGGRAIGLIRRVHGETARGPTLR